MKYLIHLEDCRFSAEEFVTHALSVLESIVKWINEQETEKKLWDGGKSFQHRMEILRIDLEYLKSDLIKTSKDIEGIQNVIREQLSLSRGRRDYMFGLLAAIYLPLSFTTSFFGMNIDPYVPPGYQELSNSTKTWLKGLPVDTYNSTGALVSAINTSGSMNWSWPDFGIMLGCLLLTLPLTLAAGGIFRWSVQSATRYVKYWRIIYLIACIAFVLFSIGGNFLINDFTWILGIICNLTLLLILIFNVWHSYPNRSSFLYIGLLLFTALCVGVQFFFWYLPMMIFPWVLFASIWLGRRWKKWKHA